MRSTTLVGSSVAGCVDDLLALGLLLDELEHPLAVLVVVLLGLELGGQGLDELAGHLHLAVADVDVVARQASSRRAVVDLVGVEHRLQHERVARGRMAARYCLVRSTSRAMPTLLRLLHGLDAAARTPWRRPCRARGSRAARSRSGRSGRGRRSPRCRSSGSPWGRAPRAPGLDGDVVVRARLVALDDLLVGHLLAGVGRHPLLLDARVGARSSWLKRTSLGETALNSFTGTLTSPKLMAPLQMGRGTSLLSLRIGTFRTIYVVMSSQALERRVAQRALLGPLGELDLADDGARRSGAGPTRRVDERARRRVPAARGARSRSVQHLVGEAGADVARRSAARSPSW